MSDAMTLSIDGREIPARPGQTVLEAAEEAGIYIPRLCRMEGLRPAGNCRVCTVRINGRPQSACTYPVAPGMVVENDTEELRVLRRDLIDMLFVEGNHFCMFCEKSGACELQALAYRFGITAPKYPYLFPKRTVDASHPEILIDRNRCILCGRCVRASEQLDGKHIFDFVGRGREKRIAVDAEKGLGGTDAAAADHAVASCPTGSLLVKRVGFAVPVGQRTFDRGPIGSDIERNASGK
jgi:[NiFe] hydrogenase diaphorase moiety small subunit